MNIALIGYGFMGTTHMQALGQIPGVNLAGVVTGHAEKLPKDVRPLSLAEALNDPAIDAVDICLPTHLHASVTSDALRAGKHVLVEKPMALNAASARAMAAEAAERGRILMTAQVLRFWPAYVGLRETVRSQQFGAVRHARFERRSAKPTWGAWLLDPALSGGGAFDLLIHDVDMCLHLFGPPGQVAATYYADAGSGASLLDAQLYYRDLVAHVSGGWQHAGALPFRMEYTVTFEGATAEYNSVGRPAKLYSPGETRLLETGEGDSAGAAYAAEIAYFVDCCRNGSVPEFCPPNESADAVALTALLLRAGQKNGEVMPCQL